MSKDRGQEFTFVCVCVLFAYVQVQTQVDFRKNSASEMSMRITHSTSNTHHTKHKTVTTPPLHHIPSDLGTRGREATSP